MVRIFSQKYSARDVTVLVLKSGLLSFFLSLYTSFKALILSRDYSNLRSDFQKSNNILTLECDGQKINVQIGVELQF